MKEQLTQTPSLQKLAREFPTLTLHVKALGILKTTTPISQDEEKALLAYSLWADDPKASKNIAHVLGISSSDLYRYIERISHSPELEEKYTTLDDMLTVLQEEEDQKSQNPAQTVVFRSQAPYLNNRRPETEKRDSEIRKIKAQGLSTWEIGNQLGIPTNQVQSALQRLRGIGELPPIGFSKDDYEDMYQKVCTLKEEGYDTKAIVKEIIFHYQHIVFNQAQLGRICNVSRQKIHTIFKELQNEGFLVPQKVRKPIREIFKEKR